MVAVRSSLQPTIAHEDRHTAHVCRTEQPRVVVSRDAELLADAVSCTPARACMDHPDELVRTGLRHAVPQVQSISSCQGPKVFLCIGRRGREAEAHKDSARRVLNGVG